MRWMSLTRGAGPGKSTGSPRGSARAPDDGAVIEQRWAGPRPARPAPAGKPSPCCEQDEHGRLWHPVDSTRPDATLTGLANIAR